MCRLSLLRCTIATIACLLASPAVGATADYTAEFVATWSGTTHPGAYPAGAHFSPLIGGVHNDVVSFWSPGGFSTLGIERMAELGATASLQAEVQTAIDAGNAAAILLGSAIDSPGSTHVTLQASTEFPLVTLVTMVAPSPDWFVGVHDLDLRDGTGWQNELSVDLYTYDAGTDNGVNFTSADIDALPKQPIALLGSPFAAGSPPLGTFHFKRLYEGRPLGDYNLNGLVDAADYTTWRNSLGQTGVNLDADGTLDGNIDQEDYHVWKTHYGLDLTSGAGEAAGVEPIAAPEPATATLALFAACILLFRRAPDRSTDFSPSANQ
jgi:hypothetical protein